MNTTLLLVIGGLVVGACFALLSRQPVKQLINRFKSQAPLIQRYWVIILPYSLALAIAYVVVWRYFYSTTNFEVLGQIAGIVLAIFVGYIAFMELSEARFDRHVKAAADYSRGDKLKSAIIELEAAHAIKRKDASVLGNLLELKLIMGQDSMFDEKIEAYKTAVIEEPDKLCYHYLVTLRHLLLEHIGEARTAIKDTIDFVEEDPGIRQKFAWSFNELKHSASYKNLSASTKKILDHYIKFLQPQQGALTAEQETKFKNGEYDF